jgi:hypothetical protein
MEVRIALDQSLCGCLTLPYLQRLVGDSLRLVVSHRPDFVFYGPFRPEPRKGPVRLFWTGENVRPDFDRYDWLFTFDLDDQVRHPRHMRIPVWHPELPLSVEGLSRPRFPKTKFCNFVYFAPNALREKFYDLLSRYKRVDAPGARKRNMQPIESTSAHSSRFGHDWPDAKRRFLQPYKFTIAFENEAFPGYVTEKLYHPLLVDSIPIYWGNPEIARDYNPRCFVDVRSFRTLAEAVEQVMELDRDRSAYRSMLSEPYYERGGEFVARHLEALRERLRGILAGS